MKPLLSCYFYPTTLTCIDDDLSFLKSLKALLEEQNPVQDFFSPFDAAAFLDHLTKSGSDTEYSKIESIDAIHIDVHLQRIQNLIYDASRFKQVSILIVDYFMPGIDGLSFCRKFKDSPYQKIMLTGEADQDLAISAFNEGSINQFIMKGDGNAIDKILALVQKMQLQFFKVRTTFLVESLLQVRPQVFQYFKDADFVTKIEALFKEYAIRECYLFDLDSTYLLIDKDNTLWWMHIKNKQAIKTLMQETKSLFLEDPSPEAEAVYTKIMSEKQQPLSALIKALPHHLEEWTEILVNPIEIRTLENTYQILISKDIGKASLDYAKIQFFP